MLLVAALLGWIGSAEAHVPVTVTVFPSDDWCAIVGAGLTGDVYLMVGGDYVGPCTIPGPVPDQYGERVVVRSFDPVVDRAVFRGDGVADHVLRLTGYEVSLEDVDVADVPAGVDGVRFEGDGHRLAGVRFLGVTGAAVRQTGGAAGFEVRDTRFELLGGLGVGLGCPGCGSVDHLVRDDLFLGAGTAVEGRDGAVATVRDVVVGDSDVGVRWTAGGDGTVIEENLLVTRSEGVRLDGGAATARNNVIRAATGVVSVGPGAHRVFGNTLLATAGRGLVVEGWTDASGLDVRSNAWTGEVTPPAGARFEGNLGCADEACGCWVAPADLDVHPPPDSPLRDGGATMAFGELNADWCGNPRPEVPTAGALQAVSLAGPGPLAVDFKDDCAAPPDPDPADLPCASSVVGDSGAPDSEPSRPHRDRAERSGCGCATGGSGAGWWASAGALLWLGARSRRRIGYTGDHEHLGGRGAGGGRLRGRGRGRLDHAVHAGRLARAPREASADRPHRSPRSGPDRGAVRVPGVGAVAGGRRHRGHRDRRDRDRARRGPGLDPAG